MMGIQSIIRSGCSLTAVGLALAACNAAPLLQPGSLIQTGSLTKPQAAVVPKVTTPTDRALYVAATAARAQKCGFYFDPAALRNNFLAAETARGTPPNAITRTGQSYDYTAKSISAKITKPETYCSKARTTVIKASLQNALAGNYEPPVKKKVVDNNDGGLFGLFENVETKKTVFNPDHIYDPQLHEEAEKPAEE